MRKFVELGNRKTTARNLSMDRPQRNSVQLKKGEKIFQVTIGEVIQMKQSTNNGILIWKKHSQQRWGPSKA